MSYLYVFLTVTVFLFCTVVSLTSYVRVFVSENIVLCRIFGIFVSVRAAEWTQLHCCIHPMLLWGLNVGEYTCEIQDCVKYGLIIWILDRSCWWKDNIKMRSRYRLYVRSVGQIRIVPLWVLILDFGNTTTMIHTFQERREFPYQPNNDRFLKTIRDGDSFSS